VCFKRTDERDPLVDDHGPEDLAGWPGQPGATVTLNDSEAALH
jgi:hypothetical protein